MANWIRNLYHQKPLRFVLLAGFLVRMVSVIFSHGFGMFDDHYLVIEASQSWIDGHDYNNWLPWNSVSGGPTGHSFFYVGLHFIYLYLLEFVGIDDPMLKMFFVRLAHGLFSLLTIYLGFKITEKLANTATARTVGLLLALYWFFPILSVRTLVEVSCVPFILAAFWYVIRKEAGYKDLILAGIFMGIAIAIRIQSYLLLGGIGLVLLFDRKIIGAAIFGMVAMVTLFLSQITDIFLWGYPFAEIQEYVRFNSTSYDHFITMAWYQYLLVLSGILIPPVSIYFFVGFFRQWKKHLVIFLPVFIFLAFHSIYPNKQERFIFPIIPLFVILGMIGWDAFRKGSSFWQKNTQLYKISLGFFWTLNLILLLLVSPAPSKKSLVESMYFIRDHDVTGILVEHTVNDHIYMLPRFYSDKWAIKHFNYRKTEMEQFEEVGIQELIDKIDLNYCFFIEDNQLDERVGRLKESYPEMKHLATIEPSYIDKFLHWGQFQQ